MIKKRTNRISALILSIVLITSLTGVSAQCAMEAPLPSDAATASSNYISMVYASLSISDDIAYCTSGCQSYTSTVTSSKVQCELQYYSGGEWKTFNSWLVSGGCNLTTSPTQGNLYHGYTYRVKTTGFAYYNGILVDTMSTYSYLVQYN